LKLTAEDLHGFGLVDQVVPEPQGGAQNDLNKAAALLRPFISDTLGKLRALSARDLLARRHQRLRRLASFVSET